MAYVDHAFSISDEDDLVGGAVGGPRGAPVKEIAFAAALLAFGALGAIGGILMAANRVGGDRAHGIFFMILGIVMFIPGFYYTRIAYYAYKGRRLCYREEKSTMNTSPNRMVSELVEVADFSCCERWK
ncbi:hypothetical protein GUJ93_ZPchr0006g42028 [Zizania palustris]|uniref:Transmembrane protein 230 n=1 Tax=Zizania palustris TaxID=103762 RepID=A0A8J5SNX1_ZIZPA|nr:hypothetical protein GUJ93_ZPchr0006g42028 [Zizania palustris]